MTAPRFLIEKNLSPALVGPARERGFEAMHVNHLGLRMETDWELLKAIAEQDWVLVTNNGIEFRGRYRDIELSQPVSHQLGCRSAPLYRDCICMLHSNMKQLNELLSEMEFL